MPRRRTGVEPAWFLYTAFFLFVVSIAIEAIKLGGGINSERSMIGPTKITGYLLFLVAIFDFRAALLTIPGPVIWWGSFVAVGMIGTVIHWEVSVLGLVLTTPQNVVLFWIGCNVMRWNAGWRLFLGGLLGGIAFASIAQLTGFGVGEGDVEGVYVAGVGMLERASALGEDPNFAAAYRALGVLVVAMLMLDRRLRWWLRLVCVGAGLLAMASIAQTGSRGGLLVAACGFMVFVAVQRRWTTRFAGGVIAVVAAVGFAAVVSASPVFVERVRAAWETGDTAHRMDIWLMALRVFWDSPIYGFGLQTYVIPLGQALGVTHIATHNIWLSVLLSSGAVGMAFFLTGVWSIVYNCLRRWRDPDVAMALVQLGTVMAAGMTLNVELKKWFWLVLAAAYARCCAAKERAQREGCHRKNSRSVGL